tara:strand:- start:160 stop:405 length:246 start_codon:yes stop_codon:yes gene_type:complete
VSGGAVPLLIRPKGRNTIKKKGQEMAKHFSEKELKALEDIAEARFYRAEKNSVKEHRSENYRDYWKLQAEFWLGLANKLGS